MEMEGRQNASTIYLIRKALIWGTRRERGLGEASYWFLIRYTMGYPLSHSNDMDLCRYRTSSGFVHTVPFLVPAWYNPREEPTMPDEDVYQLKLRIEQQLFERLSELAKSCGFSSANQFAGEALDQYAELLADLLTEQREESKIFRDKQCERLLEAFKSFQDKPKRK